MRSRILFVAGIAVGYVVGARAGRSAYDSVVDRVKGVADSGAVKQVAEKAKATLEEKAPKVAEVASQAAETATAAASAAKEAGESAAADAKDEAAKGEPAKPTDGAKTSSQKAPDAPKPGPAA